MSLAKYLAQHKTQKSKPWYIAVSYTSSATLLGFFIAYRFNGGWPIVTICAIGMGAIPAYCLA